MKRSAYDDLLCDQCCLDRWSAIVWPGASERILAYDEHVLVREYKTVPQHRVVPKLGVQYPIIGAIVAIFRAWQMIGERRVFPASSRHDMNVKGHNPPSGVAVDGDCTAPTKKGRTKS
ncbi:unnamed protein product [Cyprideis torosa]|uniref:Uncharacterized protein n=1 Tax=Cyprideis torosa TaxID=163714 RepID=A0A7R8WJ96_9CRUS|nr:unnamed protein product [Cyprideis torosa]CAG0895689.1 unnamed protein product [Cyprideis torosa]